MAVKAASGSASGLTIRLLRGMILPMAGLALVLGLGGAWAINEAVEAVNDRILSAAARAMADSLSVEDGAIALDLSPSVFGMLEDSARDSVYYNVRYRGKVITGYADLPDISPRGMIDSRRVFGSGNYRGHELRIVSESRRLSDIDGTVIVEVAETLDARNAISRRLLLALALLETALIVMSLLLLPIAVRWGLKPLRGVTEEMDRRVDSDLTPIPLRNVPSELRELVGAFNAMLARLGSAIENIQRFTADASHQMRTPLSILRAHIAILKRVDPASDEGRRSISDIDQASDRLQHLLVQLLALARADSTAPTSLELAPVDLDKLAASVTGNFALPAIRAGVNLQFQQAAADICVVTHETLAGELLSNLIDNAIRYNRPGGTVTVSVHASAPNATVVIEDDGPGIAPDERSKAFQRFTRLDSTPSTGSGLGLPIAQALARAIDATLTLETSSLGRGLRAVVTLRIRDENPPTA